MKKQDIEETWEEFNSEYLKFDMITNKLSNRPDIHAFILLDKIVPGKSCIVSGGSHEMIYLGVSLQDLENNLITKFQILELIRCGVMIEDGYICMLV